MQTEPHFTDRDDAGRRLALRLQSYAHTNAIVYALPRGGVVIGATIATTLHLPLDLIITRKIGHPINPEYAIGAVAEDGHFISDPSSMVDVDNKWLRAEIERQQSEAKRRRETYLAHKPPRAVVDATAILVDDGIATGLTMRCAINELKHRNPRAIIVAIPVASPDSLALIRPLVDEIICLSTPPTMGSIGAFYDMFPQVEDAEVIRLMQSIPSL